MNYEELMLRAITKANKFKYTAKPNPVVGAIIIQGGEIISEGYHEIYGKNHAEINAIEEAQKHLGKKFENFSDLSLICTLEPCSHVGKTGSCAEFIVKKGFKKVIIGAIDPNPKVAGRGIKILESNDIEVEYGLFGDLVEKQNKNFFYKHKNNKPYITVKIASSLDGMSHIGTERVFITSESSRNDVQKIRADHDAILTGGNTLRNDDPYMNARVDFSVNQATSVFSHSSHCTHALRVSLCCSVMAAQSWVEAFISLSLATLPPSRNTSLSKLRAATYGGDGCQHHPASACCARGPTSYRGGVVVALPGPPGRCPTIPITGQPTRTRSERVARMLRPVPAGPHATPRLAPKCLHLL